MSELEGVRREWIQCDPIEGYEQICLQRDDRWFAQVVDSDLYVGSLLFEKMPNGSFEQRMRNGNLVSSDVEIQRMIEWMDNVIAENGW
jgi:hypothetical protein